MARATIPGDSKVRIRRRRPYANLLYLAPMASLLGAFVYFAIGYTLNLSLYQWDGIGPNPLYIGLENYSKLLKDPFFWEAVEHTVILGLVVLLLQNGIGFALAILIRVKVRLRTFYSLLFFVPVVLAPAVLAYVFRRLLDPTSEASQFATSIGLDGLVHAWLGDPNTVLFAICGIIIWEYAGFSFLLYTAGLTQIDPMIYEAARLDGASLFQLARRIAFPLLRRTHVTLMILSIVGAMKIFEIVYLTTGGGPNRASEFVSTYLYQKAIPEFAAGYGAAIAVVLITAALILTAVQLWLFRRSEA
jgi:raffinose/stachyose/melibiose transport system permease protein